MKIQYLNNCGVEISDIDVSNLSLSDYNEIKKIYLEHLIVVIKNQKVKTLPFAKIVYFLGDMTSHWGQSRWTRTGNIIKNKPASVINPFEFQGRDEDYPIQRVTGKKKNGQLTGIFGTGKLDWHANINSSKILDNQTFCGVALLGISKSIIGTSTSWLDTTKAYNDMPESLKQRCENVTGHFECSPEVWAEGLPDIQFKKIIELNTKNEYKMKLVQKNKNGKKGLYFHYLNKCRFPEDPELLNILIDFCIQDKYIYRHWWQPGDIVLSDQLQTIHKRDQDGDNMLKNRILGRYTFNYT